MTTVELTYEAAQAETARLAEEQGRWTEKRAQLAADLDALQARAGADALAGTSTTTIAERIRGMETEVQIADRALQAIDLQQHEAGQVAQRARIAELRAQAAAKREQAAAISAEAEPHLAALERIEGTRPYFEQSRSLALHREADHIDRSIEWLESRLEQ